MKHHSKHPFVQLIRKGGLNISQEQIEALLDGKKISLESNNTLDNFFHFAEYAKGLLPRTINTLSIDESLRTEKSARKCKGWPISENDNCTLFWFPLLHFCTECK